MEEFADGQVNRADCIHFRAASSAAPFTVSLLATENPVPEHRSSLRPDRYRYSIYPRV
jgi:hypothetical protein